MLITQQPKARIVHKNVWTKSGQEMLGVFLVVEYLGEVRFKVISLRPVDTVFSTAQYYLPQAPIKTNSLFSYTKKGEKIISPYKNLLYFISQLTRGPSFR